MAPVIGFLAQRAAAVLAVCRHAFEQLEAAAFEVGGLGLGSAAVNA
jgi:hypothetical protein